MRWEEPGPFVEQSCCSSLHFAGENSRRRADRTTSLGFVWSYATRSISGDTKQPLNWSFYGWALSAQPVTTLAQRAIDPCLPGQRAVGRAVSAGKGRTGQQGRRQNRKLAWRELHTSQDVTNHFHSKARGRCQLCLSESLWSPQITSRGTITRPDTPSPLVLRAGDISNGSWWHPEWDSAAATHLPLSVL